MAPAEDDPTRARRPVRLDPRGGAAGGAASPPAPDLTTMARPAVLHQAGWSGATEPGGQQAAAATYVGARPATRRPSRSLLLAGGGVLVAVVAVVAFLTLGRGGGQPGGTPGTGQPTQATGQGSAAASGQSALGPGATAPGEPSVTAAPAGSGQVKFSWTYANPEPGDSFRWQRVSGTAGDPAGVVSKPKLVISLPPGQTVCILVQARRAGGQASEPSKPACWPS